MDFSSKDDRKLPLGFGMALAQNTSAMKVFATLSENQQQRCIERARMVNSKDEMEKLVDDIEKTIL